MSEIDELTGKELDMAFAAATGWPLLAAVVKREIEHPYVKVF